MKKMKKAISILVASAMCMGVVTPLAIEKNVHASELTSYVVNLPTESNVTNVQGAEESVQFIDISFKNESIGEVLQDAITIKDSSGEEINVIYFSVEGKIRIPVSNFDSDTTYTLSITPSGLNAYNQSFATGTIVDYTDVANGLEIRKKLTYSVIDLLRGYDLDSVTITTEDNIGAEVLLTRNIEEDFSDMTSLGTISSVEQTFFIDGYDIGKYQYVIVKGKGNVQEINAYVSSESMKGVKARPIGGDNVELRFTTFSDLHLQQQQREVNHLTNILVKSKSEEFGGRLDALVMVGDIHYMFPGEDSWTKGEMLNRYARLKTILTENGYGYNNMDTDTDDVIPTIYAAGNHEYSLQKNNDIHAQLFTDQVGSFHSHKVINGYHFIAASSNYDAMMTEDAAAWTKAEIEKAIADDPTGTKPIFVFAHSQALNRNQYNTVNTTYYPGKSTELVEWMKNYPQIVMISGHTHYVMQQQSTVGQSGFTQVMLGLTAGGDVEGPGNTSGFVYDPIDTLSDELTYHPQGAIVEVKNNVAYVYKIDFKTGGQIGEPWVIDTQGLSEGTAREYYTSQRYEYSMAPYFEENAADEVVVDYTTTSTTADTGDAIYSMDAKITFPQAKCDGIYGDKYPLVYQLHIYDNETGTLCKSYAKYSDAIYWSKGYELAETYTIDLPELVLGRDYRVDIHAGNSFGKYSEPLSVVISMDPNKLSSEVAISAANILSNDYYETEIDGYQFFSNDATGEVFDVEYTATTSYSLEATFHMPMKQTGRLVGTDTHNLSVQSSGLVYTYTVDGVEQTLSTANYYVGTCIDVVATCDDNVAKLYVDGVLVAAASITGTVDELSGSITVGREVFASILKARVFDKVLSADEIIALNKETSEHIPADGWVTLLSVEDISTNAIVYEDLDVSRLVDGNVSNYTALMGAAPREIVIDLGDVYDIETVVLYQRNGSAEDTKFLKIQTSKEYIAIENEATRSFVYQDTEGVGFTQGEVPNYMEVADTDSTFRYVYLSSTNGSLLVINEFKIFGKAVTK